MIERKRDVNELYERQGEEQPYDLSFADDKRNYELKDWAHITICFV